MRSRYTVSDLWSSHTDSLCVRGKEVGRDERPVYGVRYVPFNSDDTGLLGVQSSEYPVFKVKPSPSDSYDLRSQGWVVGRKFYFYSGSLFTW